MKALSRAAPWLFAVVVLAGCASSNVTAYQPYQGKIDRPDRIIVYDFAVTPSDLPAEVAIAGQGLASAPQTAAQLATGRKLGAEIAKDLVAELQTMGLPAVRAVGQPGPRVGDGLVVGYFASVDAGSATERVVLGFGAGGAELKTVVKGFLMTAQGLRALGSGEVEAGSGKMPGGAVPLAGYRRDRQSNRPCRFRRGESLRGGVRLGDDRRRSPTHGSAKLRARFGLQPRGRGGSSRVGCKTGR